MKPIRSMEDLAQARETALEQQRLRELTKRFHIRVGMASCSIAVGAADTLEAIQHMIENDNIPGVSSDQIHVSITGCIGLCALEPIVQVETAGQSMVTYGKVTPLVARRILQDHVGKGLIVQEYIVENV